MLKINHFSIKGSKLEAFNLPKDFAEKGSLSLVAQAKRVYEAKKHTGLAKTKTRAEINRTKKKWYKQKGTGGARHGSKSAPIFVGGGVAHGPKNIERKLNLSSKMAKKALATSLWLKAESGEMVVVSGLGTLKKTKEAASLVSKVLSSKTALPKITLVLSDENKTNCSRFFANIPNLKAVNFKGLNVYQVLTGGKLILDEDLFDKPVEKVVKTTKTDSKKAVKKETKKK